MIPSLHDTPPAPPPRTDPHLGALRALARGDGERVLLAADDPATVEPVVPTLDLAVPAEEVGFAFEGVAYGPHSLPVTW
ncbi:hypothetical protein [Nocardiopsis sp. LOL_012]|uniref:hypothetical protein n=1 Tax=Nocardiopsis sp. LOL_012 TaxID=3345409 RepID=UPI003A853035